MQEVDFLRPLMTNKSVIYTKIEDELVIMDPNDGGYHGLNAAGARLWMILDKKPTPLDDLSDYLKVTYALEGAVAKADAHAFVVSMLEKQFLVFSDDAS